MKKVSLKILKHVIGVIYDMIDMSFPEQVRRIVDAEVLIRDHSFKSNIVNVVSRRLI